jgi:hypothetical protein
MTMNGDEQYERGMEALRQADGGAGQRLLEALADVSPELSYRSVAWSYGDLYVRPKLPRRNSRRLGTRLLRRQTNLIFIHPAPTSAGGYFGHPVQILVSDCDHHRGLEVNEGFQ